METAGNRIALVGASGWVGRNLGPALLRAGVCGADDLLCVNRTGACAEYAAWPGVRWTTDVAMAVEASGTVILSVRPDQFRAGIFRAHDRLVISLLAGASSREIEDRTGSGRVVLAIPNAAVELSRAYTPWYGGSTLTDADAQLVNRILTCVGGTDRVASEDDLYTLTALSGAGHAYAAMLAAALHEAAVGMGLDPRIAAQAVEAVVCDAAPLLQGRGGTADQIVDVFVSYAGTTAAAIAAARAAGFDEAVRRALVAGRDAASRAGRATGPLEAPHRDEGAETPV